MGRTTYVRSAEVESVSTPSDSRRLLLTGLLALWIIAFVYAFVAFATTAPTGEGFVRGANRVMTYLGWQGIAGVLSIATFAIGRDWPKGSGVRTMSFIPLAIALLHILAIVAIVLWARAAG